jgi:hypothetical protein
MECNPQSSYKQSTSSWPVTATDRFLNPATHSQGILGRQNKSDDEFWAGKLVILSSITFP